MASFQRHIQGLLVLLLVSSCLHAQEIMRVHNRGTHSIGGMVDFFSFTGGNLRYAYAFKNHMELGLNLDGYFSSRYFPTPGESKTWLSSYSFSPFYRYYLGRSAFGTFFEGGYELEMSSIWGYPIIPGTRNINPNAPVEKSTHVVGHWVYASLGLYYHGFARERLGIETSIGAGTGYQVNYWEDHYRLRMVGSLRLVYFFGHKK